MKKLLFIFAAIGIFATAVYAFELNQETKKADPVFGDLVGIEDSENGWNLGAVELGNIYKAFEPQSLADKLNGTDVILKTLTLEPSTLPAIGWSDSDFESTNKLAGQFTFNATDTTIGDEKVSGILSYRNGATMDPVFEINGETGSIDFFLDINFNPATIGSASLSSFSKNTTFASPDTLVDITTTWPVLSVPSEMYPNGITIKSIRVSTLVACTDTLEFQEWNMGTASSTSLVESVTMSGVYTKITTFTDAILATDTTLYVEFPATPTDTPIYDITVTFTANE